MVKNKKSAASIKKARHFELVRITEYLVSGGVYFWTGYLVFFIAYSVFGWNLWWAKLISNVIGWVVNFMLQRFWVFKDPQGRSGLAKHREEVTFRYAVITLVDFVLDYFIVRGLQIIGISPYLGQFASAGFFTVWNYLWYRSWVFTSRIHRRKKIQPTKKGKR